MNKPSTWPKAHRQSDTQRSHLTAAFVLALALAIGISYSTPLYANTSNHGDGPRVPVQPLAVDQARTIEISDSSGTDPLTPSEIALVQHTSMASAEFMVQQGKAIRMSRSSRTSVLADVQFLFAERHDEGKDAAPQAARDTATDVRRADVFLYDYANDIVLHQIVNVKTSHVDESFTEQRQLPVTSVEATAAVQLMLDNPLLGVTLRQMHRQASGQDLTDASDVAAQGGIFFADSAVDSPLGKITGICRVHRCIQLFLPYDPQHFIDTSNLVVDLSAAIPVFG